MAEPAQKDDDEDGNEDEDKPNPNRKRAQPRFSDAVEIARIGANERTTRTGIICGMIVALAIVGAVLWANLSTPSWLSALTALLGWLGPSSVLTWGLKKVISDRDKIRDRSKEQDQTILDLTKQVEELKQQVAEAPAPGKAPVHIKPADAENLRKLQEKYPQENRGDENNQIQRRLE